MEAGGRCCSVDPDVVDILESIPGEPTEDEAQSDVNNC